MKIDRIDSGEYKKIFDQSKFIYNTVDFNILNRNKCDNLHFLFLHDDKRKLGLIAGEINKDLLCPFSAPFSFFSMKGRRLRFDCLKDFLALLDEYASVQGIKSLKFTFPPCFYDNNLINKMILSMDRCGYNNSLSINHHFDTDLYLRYVDGSIDKNIRYSVKTAERYGLIFKRAENIFEYRSAFDVIENNKKSKDRPQSMSFDQLMDMQKLIEIDFFLVILENNSIASAISYRHNCSIAQVIFWGALPDSSNYYPMNYLVFKMLSYYYERKIKIIDLGTSMNGYDFNFGLINFKDNIGADTSVKYSFSKNIISGN